MAAVRIIALLWASLAILSPVSDCRADPVGTTDCPDDQTCRFPTPEECAEGDNNGVWDGGPAGRGSVCLGGGGHVALYIGGNPLVPCGQVIVADQNVTEGPTAGWGSDPNACPYPGFATEVHDPSIAKQDGVYYVFGTGVGIPIRTSTDLVTWTPAGQAFPGNLPNWAPQVIPGAEFPWAPDISFFSNAWHLYYAISTFGSKRSAIGLATSPSLGPGSIWTDQGIVVESSEVTDYNAIDPNLFIDDDGTPWLAWGSFWGGIKLARIDPSTGKLSSPAPMLTIASRLNPIWGIEAPFLVKRGAYYYLFVSFDFCCRGVYSNYNIRVGRSSSLFGPYVDDRGVPMLAGGGTLVLEGSGDRRGPGHNAVLRDDGDVWRLVFHYYDAANAGTATLGIRPICWTADGWPAVAW